MAGSFSWRRLRRRKKPPIDGGAIRSSKFKEVATSNHATSLSSRLFQVAADLVRNKWYGPGAQIFMGEVKRGEWPSGEGEMESVLRNPSVITLITKTGNEHPLRLGQCTHSDVELRAFLTSEQNVDHTVWSDSIHAMALATMLRGNILPRVSIRRTSLFNRASPRQ